jgi:hypothetical protein
VCYCEYGVSFFGAAQVLLEHKLGHLSEVCLQSGVLRPLLLDLALSLCALVFDFALLRRDPPGTSENHQRDGEGAEYRQPILDRLPPEPPTGMSLPITHDFDYHDS